MTRVPVRLVYATAVFVAAVALSAAHAAAPKPQHVRGEIVSASASGIVVKTRDGTTVRMSLPPKVRISGLAETYLERIAKGAYIGTAAEPAADGTLYAQEVVVFPPAMHGVGEGHRPWDLTPGSTMTNAAVEAVVDGMKGRVMTLVYKGGRQEVTIPPGTPIVTIVKADRAMLKPGAHVFALARKGADGTWTPIRISIGVNGLIPPM